MVTIGGAESAPPRGKEDILKAVGIRVKIFSKIYKNFPNRKIFGGLLHVDKTYQGKHIVNQNFIMHEKMVV